MHEPVDQPPAGIVTLRDIVRFAASRFNEAGLHFGHGTDNAIDEAAALALHALSLPPELPDLYWGSRLTRRERIAVMALVRRRIEERIPLPYLTGEIHFAGLPFHVDRRVLIPRSPIAELIEAGFGPWLEPAAVERILEIGTGSGCIAIACAYAFPEAHIDAVDNCSAALEVAALNRHRHGLQQRVDLICSDLFEAVPEGAAYQLIVSNPPYVDAAAMAALPPEYHHEPHAALAAGADGLDVVRRLLAEAPRRLSHDGLLVIEVGDSERALQAAFPGLPAVWVEFERGGHGVFVIPGEDLHAWAH